MGAVGSPSVYDMMREVWQVFLLYVFMHPVRHELWLSSGLRGKRQTHQSEHDSAGNERINGEPVWRILSVSRVWCAQRSTFTVNDCVDEKVV